MLLHPSFGCKLLVLLIVALLIVFFFPYKSVMASAYACFGVNADDIKLILQKGKNTKTIITSSKKLTTRTFDRDAIAVTSMFFYPLLTKGFLP